MMKAIHWMQKKSAIVAKLIITTSNATNRLISIYGVEGMWSLVLWHALLCWQQHPEEPKLYRVWRSVCLSIYSVPDAMNTMKEWVMERFWSKHKQTSFNLVANWHLYHIMRKLTSVAHEHRARNILYSFKSAVLTLDCCANTATLSAIGIGAWIGELEMKWRFAEEG